MRAQRLRRSVQRRINGGLIGVRVHRLVITQLPPQSSMTMFRPSRLGVNDATSCRVKGKVDGRRRAQYARQQQRHLFSFDVHLKADKPSAPPPPPRFVQ
jgi:hypothetical protein